ncbi:MAG TPA: antibiotic biosynthesis monooxygenase [Dehalococcoidia bacterium]|nr:antibiotic biosynthesis monooxygenase [Dehalococcoidia bacterium]
MYLTREEVLVRAGRAAQYEDETAAYFDILQRQAGFLRATLLNSLGVPARYTRLVQWENRDLGKSFDRSAALVAFTREHPADETYAASRPVEAYENVHRILGSSAPVATYLIDEIVGPGPTTLQEFEESRGAVYQLRKQFGPGFAASLLSRFLGGANRYLIFGSFASDGDDRRTGETPEIVGYWAAHPSASKLVTSAIRDPQALVISANEEPI